MLFPFQIQIQSLLLTLCQSFVQLSVPSAFSLSCPLELPISVVRSSSEQNANAGGVNTDPPPAYPHVVT